MKTAVASSTRQKYDDFVITSFLKAVQPLEIAKAQGASVTSVEGKEYIDCFAGIAVVNAGHCNPEVIRAAQEQMQKLVHCCSYMYYVQPVADLAEKLAEISPGRLTKTFFANSGAEAIEGALKMAKLYTGKSEFIALEASFHGRTLATLSITGNAGRKRRGGPYAPGVVFAPAPYAYRRQERAEEVGKACAEALETLIRLHTADNVAAFIAEPVMGEGGIIVPPSDYFKHVKPILDAHQILFIADEVQSGFGRTGKMFAIEHYDVEPDILVTAKGIADGFPLSGFTTRPEIAASFRPGDHLSTFGGNPVCCAAALASIQFIEKHDLCSHAHSMGEFALEAFNDLGKKHATIGEARGKGLMIGVELVKAGTKEPDSALAESVRRKCLEEGVLIGVGGIYGNVVRIQPPLVIERSKLQKAIEIFGEALAG